ncbi:MAG: DUF2490 domain-containing protein, partial [Bacteroidota bacterium]
MLTSGALHGQTYNEAQHWCSLTAEGNLPGPYKAALQVESRTDLSERMLVNLFANFSVQREWNENISTELHYRVMVRDPGTDAEKAQRLMLDVTGLKPIGKTTVSLRFRLGQEDETGMDADGFFISGGSAVFRQKLAVKREVGRTQFSLSVEQFESITRSGFNPDQLRVVLASEFKLSKRQRISLFLMSQHLSSGTKRFNVGTGYTYR